MSFDLLLVVLAGLVLLVALLRSGLHLLIIAWGVKVDALFKASTDTFWSDFWEVVKERHDGFLVLIGLLFLPFWFLVVHVRIALRQHQRLFLNDFFGPLVELTALMSRPVEENKERLNWSHKAFQGWNAVLEDKEREQALFVSTFRGWLDQKNSQSHNARRAIQQLQEKAKPSEQLLVCLYLQELQHVQKNPAPEWWLELPQTLQCSRELHPLLTMSREHYDLLSTREQTRKLNTSERLALFDLPETATEREFERAAKLWFRALKETEELEVGTYWPGAVERMRKRVENLQLSLRREFSE